jgi:protein-ribulosamine 3-kinase
MDLPESLLRSVESTLGTTISQIVRCSGGDINQAAKIITPHSAFFVKWHAQSPPEMFAAESRGLQFLKAAGIIRVPAVFIAQDRVDDCPGYLVLEWLEQGSRLSFTDTQLGAQLAALHYITTDQYGLDHHNFIGALPQSNHKHSSWVEFYAQERISAQMQIARQNGQLPSEREELLNKLLGHLSELLPENPPPSLLHGDLWSGNVLVLASGQPAVIDPAVYYGHREVEIAFTELFGGFSSEFYAAYRETYPLEPDYHERRELYQLYPLMVHMNLFGGGYSYRVDSILRRYVG